MSTQSLPLFAALEPVGAEAPPTAIGAVCCESFRSPRVAWTLPPRSRSSLELSSKLI